MCYWLLIASGFVSGAPVMRASDVAAAVQSRQDSVSDIELRMRVETWTMPGDKGAVDGMPAVGIVRNCTVHYRAKGDWYYYRLEERSEPGDQDIDFTWSFDGERLYHFSPRDWGGFVCGPERATHPDLVEPYLTACGIMPTFRSDMRRWAWITTPCVELAVCATSLAGRSVLRVEVSGNAAWYLDPAMNMAPVHAVVLTDGASGMTHNSRFVDAGAGVFLPMKVERNNSNRRIMSEWHFDVSMAKVNQGLTVKDFRIEFPVHADVADMTGKATVYRRASPNADALVTELLDFARRDGMVLGAGGQAPQPPVSHTPPTAAAAAANRASGGLACGPSAVFIMLSCVGQSCSYQDLFQRLRLTEDGQTSFIRMRDVLRESGVEAELCKLSMAQLAALQGPAILGYSPGGDAPAPRHFVACTGRKGDRYCIIDPQGRFPVLPATGEWLGKRWNGAALVIGADARAQPQASAWRGLFARSAAAIMLGVVAVIWIAARRRPRLRSVA